MVATILVSSIVDPSDDGSSCETNDNDVLTKEGRNIRIMMEDRPMQDSARRQQQQNRHRRRGHRRRPSFVWLVKTILRTVVIDFVMITLFTLLVGVTLLHQIHDDYLYPQLRLMRFESDGREFTDTTYYHRHCTDEDFKTSAKTVEELIIKDDFTTKDATEHQLTHGVSVYRNLVSEETAKEMREWIIEQNKVRGKTLDVIQNYKRYSFHLENNMHPVLQRFWKELASNKQFMDGLEAIMGPDPAIIEFAAITSSYGAKNQHDHADIVPDGSPTKYARSFFPSYSLFIPLQDTTYEMGATHLCPGSHLCSSGTRDYCPRYNIPMSGRNRTLGGYWPTGWGALMNQQTTHKGMAFTHEGNITERVVLIPTFAPRPNYKKLETRQIGQGGAHSLKWNLWGHTVSDYVLSDKRMTEIQTILRSLGFIKGNGWNLLTTGSMRLANHEIESKNTDFNYWLKRGGSLWFLPKSWQGFFDEESDINDWHGYLLGTLKKTAWELKVINLVVFVAFVLILRLWDSVLAMLAIHRSNGSSLSRWLKRMVVICGAIVMCASFIQQMISKTDWAKAIKSNKAYRIPWTALGNPPPSTIPYRTDVLITKHYSSDYWASYTKLINFAHPGNKHWKDITEQYADGYARLSPSLKNDFCTSLLTWERLHRRFLTQDGERYWNRVVDEDVLKRFCHRGLSTAYDPLIDSLLEQLDILKSETRYGWWRDMVIHTNVIPSYLQQWEETLLPSPTVIQKRHTNSVVMRKVGTSPTKKMSLSANTFVPTTLCQKELLVRKESPRGVHHHQNRKQSNQGGRRRSLPPLPRPKEPIPGAWLEEGDEVDVADECRPRGQESRAIVSSALPNEATYDIEYENGEQGRSLELSCLRRLVTDVLYYDEEDDDV